ncbi:sin3 histone deacetylase corepressor complex component SDS3-like isoform X2 [Xenia sp. Carnegie-2017]|uniref:sin3 histone deacetylase corepressor complex component SDS3-like isoform X2 n=1 Tax=Xenia sp. Carnegie-2017 TaxID=2897299 RepID=UPI001F0376A5|nr:sin3 histone deacetylase corepressor complex component SDS3-like isoform X2 [Xenia sp. Carnegie-2017]
MPYKRTNQNINDKSPYKSKTRRNVKIENNDKKRKKTSGISGGTGKVKRACAQRVKQYNNMASNCDSDEDESNTEFSSDDERGFFQMAESDEDTEDASETDMAKIEEEISELKEQAYQQKLGKYKKQLQELNNGTHVDYLKKLNQLEKERDDRLFLAEVCKMYEVSWQS